jgi:hypothetical protein
MSKRYGPMGKLAEGGVLDLIPHFGPHFLRNSMISIKKILFIDVPY